MRERHRSRERRVTIYAMADARREDTPMTEMGGYLV
jgi:hypothetical protein